MTKEEFLKIVCRSRKDFCVPPTSAQEALNLIADYVLGSDYYISSVCESVEQTNTEMLYLILDAVSRDFRKDLKIYEKLYNRLNPRD